jgi:putative flippase GtrA
MAKNKRASRQKRKSELNRFIEYMISGGVWFWSGYIIIVTFDGIIGLFLANFIGNAVGITLNFLLERYWVFKTNRPTALFVATQRYIIYTALNAFLLNYLILLYFREAWNIGPEISQFIASAFFTVWNYIWYKAWVFKGVERPKRIRHHA